MTATPNRSNVHRSSARRRFGLLLGLTVTMSMTGCASRSMSLASMNPFKSKTDVGQSNPTPNAIASAATGVGTATKNAMTATSNTVGGWFGRDGKKPDAIDPNDPLALQNQPENVGADVYVANGQLWESTGNLTKAMESYSKALQTDANNAQALTSIARLHFREGNHPQAAQSFQKAIAQNPNDAALYNDLGLTLSKLGQHDMAAQTLARALQLSPGTSRYANNLASVQFDANKADAAYQTLSQNNKPAVAHFNMAYLYYKKGQSAQAQTHLQQAIAMEGESAADPATKRAVERSREMLAQMAPGTVGPNMQNVASIAPGPAAAAGPVAVVAAGPAHKAIGSPQVLGGGVSTMPGVPASPANPMFKATSNPPTTPASYQDPRSFMSPQMPSGAPASAPPTWNPTPPASATPSPAGTFQLPPGFGK